MRIPILRTIMRDDLARGGDVPQWVDVMLEPLNNFITNVGSALSGRLTIADNVSCKVVSYRFTHGVEAELSIDISRKIAGIIPCLVTQATDNNNTMTGWGMTLTGNGKVGVTINLAGGAGTKADVTLIILYG